MRVREKVSSMRRRPFSTALNSNDGAVFPCWLSPFLFRELTSAGSLRVARVFFGEGYIAVC